MQSIDGNVASSTNNDGPANAVVDNLLSEAKLTEYNATASQDYNFAESQVRREGIQLFERALHFSISHCKSETSEKQDDLELHDPAAENHTSIESISRQYPETASSSAETLERFSFLSPQNEPLAMYARRAMAEMDIAEGSLEKTKIRADAAHSVALVQPIDDSDSVKAVVSDASSESDEAKDFEEVIVVSEDEDRPADLNVSYSRVAAATADHRFVEGRQRVNRRARARARARKDNDDSKRKRRRML